ncbi:TPA: hypothetical protein ACJU83_001069 [Streptococcus pneumoniae]
MFITHPKQSYKAGIFCYFFGNSNVYTALTLRIKAPNTLRGIYRKQKRNDLIPDHSFSLFFFK